VLVLLARLISGSTIAQAVEITPLIFQVDLMIMLTSDLSLHAVYFKT